MLFRSNAAMEELAEERYSDPAEMDLEDMMQELLDYEGNLDTYSEAGIED